MPVEGGGGTLFIKRAISSKGGWAMRGRGGTAPIALPFLSAACDWAALETGATKPDQRPATRLLDRAGKRVVPADHLVELQLSHFN